MTTVLTKAMLDARRFPSERVDALFQAVLINDAVDAVTDLPERIDLEHDPELLADGFCICRQLWQEGVDRDELRTLIAVVARDRDLDADDRRRFKHMRAKLKHFRFACALYGDQHRYPRLTDWLTTALGHVQDAFKTGQGGQVAEKALVLRILLSPGPWTLMRREHDRLTLTSPQSLRAYLVREMGGLAEVVARPTVTGAEFHAARKVVSRQVAFHGTMWTIRRSDQARRMSRALAAINGLMGSMHDELVERRVAGVQDYHREQFALPPEIHARISALIDRCLACGSDIRAPPVARGAATRRPRRRRGRRPGRRCAAIQGEPQLVTGALQPPGEQRLRSGEGIGHRQPPARVMARASRPAPHSHRRPSARSLTRIAPESGPHAAGGPGRQHLRPANPSRSARAGGPGRTHISEGKSRSAPEDTNKSTNRALRRPSRFLLVAARFSGSGREGWLKERKPGSDHEKLTEDRFTAGLTSRTCGCGRPHHRASSTATRKRKDHGTGRTLTGLAPPPSLDPDQGRVVARGSCGRTGFERSRRGGLRGPAPIREAIMDYQVVAERISAHESLARTKDASLVLDADVAGRPDAFNPAELLLAAIAACMIKGIERVTP